MDRILLERSQCIYIYSFILSRIFCEKIELIYCPTEMMVANYYSKPLQGSLFRKMRYIVMGITPFPDEERVISNKDGNTVAFSINSNTENQLQRIVKIQSYTWM